MTDTLTALDATFLELEQQDEGALMSIGGVMVFDPVPGGGPAIDDVCAHLGRRLGLLPRYSQRLSATRTGGLAWPHWTPDERFDIRKHVRHVSLPAPGGRVELCEWAADFYSHRLDRTRPLWEIVLIDGLEDGRWALAHKTHHCMVDGVGSVDVAHLLLDTDPTAPAEPPIAAPSERYDGSLLAPFLPSPPAALAQAAQAGAHAAWAGVHAALHPGEALARSRSLAELLVRDELIGAPHTSINVPIGSMRRFAVVNVPLAELKAIRAELGGSVNDAVLAACTTGLRRLLLARDEQLPERGLRAMVPMNVRQGHERLALGNRISSLFVELPVAEPLAHARYRQIADATARLKASRAADGGSLMLELAALAPPIVHATLARSLYANRLFNITITNVPGPQLPLYAFGARLREIHPVVPLAADHAVGIAIFSYDGLVTFGVIADSASTPDLGVLAYGIEEGIEELLALMPDPPPGDPVQPAAVSAAARRR
jgi:WS/DGAT/MGAT family acyltransferase